ncbi:MAG: DUF1311 domain-containing protein [Hyphomicrobiales bacterium]|nr:DUF1311 domain-containing protein [Hyphomicrobiales bacterium]
MTGARVAAALAGLLLTLPAGAATSSCPRGISDAACTRGRLAQADRELARLVAAKPYLALAHREWMRLRAEECRVELYRRGKRAGPNSPQMSACLYRLTRQRIAEISKY